MLVKWNFSEPVHNEFVVQVKFTCTEGPCITRILGLRKTRVKQISRYLRTKGIRKILIFSNFVNFRPRRTIFTFLEFSAQARKEYDKNCLNN